LLLLFRVAAFFSKAQIIACVKNRQSSPNGDTIFSTKTQGLSKLNALVRFIIIGG